MKHKRLTPNFWFYYKRHGLLEGFLRWRRSRQLAKALDTLQGYSVFSGFTFKDVTLNTQVLKDHALRPLLIADCVFDGGHCGPEGEALKDLFVVSVPNPQETPEEATLRVSRWNQLLGQCQHGSKGEDDGAS